MSDKAEIEKIRALAFEIFDKMAEFDVLALRKAQGDWHKALYDHAAALDAATAERKEWALRLMAFSVPYMLTSIPFTEVLAAFEAQENVRSAKG